MIASVATAMRARSANMADVPITGPRAPEPVAHGGDLGAIRRRFPEAPQPWIDLSTGINPVAYPVAQLPPEIWSRLPTPQALPPFLAPPPPRYAAPAPPPILAP